MGNWARGDFGGGCFGRPMGKRLSGKLQQLAQDGQESGVPAEV